ncbi:exo 1,3/1,4-beta-D-glucan glucohydrolase [Massilia sp. W12]|uniref:exo 1,3/1,4-beta-D-glucan glucohydrolase n=1 Tax=Massilia sp. W12 TaxID=3126507 RepID=UPI0030D26B41
MKQHQISKLCLALALAMSGMALHAGPATPAAAPGQAVKAAAWQLGGPPAHAQGSNSVRAGVTNLADWPYVGSKIVKDPAMEARIAQIVAGMTLAQKIGQMTQPEIKSITPAQVRQYYIGSVLNGGGSWPNNNKRASVADWLNLADQYYNASISTDMAVKIPILWGTDAVHGHNNVYGATLFPHNIGLGAARDPLLVQRIAAATAIQVRATGINWAFAPTLAVARDVRWGRSYESFAEDAMLINSYASAYINGLQGVLKTDANVVGTAKHFIGDGGTANGVDQGESQVSLSEMINRHGQGYYGALAAGAQTVMASFNSWNNPQQNIAVGKMHGSKAMLTDALKQKMGFDGLVVSDWNGIGQVPGCSNSSCAQAINAGLDIIMVPDEWQAFITNTINQVNAGQIPMARINDAVTRILRVKMRAGLFNYKKPSANAYATSPANLQARALAREAVQKSLVLLKNNGGLLPFARGKRILVVGKGADNLGLQAGGWSLSWQGDGNSNADFPNGDTILSGLRQAGAVTYSLDGKGVNVSPDQFDLVLAVIGETPYAEGSGDIGAGSLRHSARYAEDLSVLQSVAGKGVPVATVFLSGRPLYVNDLLNLSNAFVAAWLPGTEGRGVADVLFKNSAGQVNIPFSGKLPFTWPGGPCQIVHADDAGATPLFAYGYGLASGAHGNPGILPVDNTRSCSSASGSVPVFNQTEKAPYKLYAGSAANDWQGVAIGSDLNAVINVPASNPSISVATSQINVQQDAKKITFNAASQLYAQSAQAVDFSALAANGALMFDLVTHSLPQGASMLAMDCGWPCRGALNPAYLFSRAPLNQKQSVTIPLSCFAAKGADMSKINTPFLLFAEKLQVSVTNIRVVQGAAGNADAIACSNLP